MPPQLPTYEQLAEKLVSLSQERSEWAGIPIPLPGLRVEPKYPYKMHFDTKDTINECPDMYEVINEWRCDRLGINVVVVETETGRREARYSNPNRATIWLETLAASKVWPLRAEQKATEKLAELINEWQMRCYLLTGTFMESSPRSKVFYLFRKGRPTVAMKADHKDQMRVLCALCQHCVGYYQGTWAGVMVPTDEVIAHLVMMRGDEKLFWKRSNQHPAHHPGAAL